MIMSHDDFVRIKIGVSELTFNLKFLNESSCWRRDQHEARAWHHGIVINAASGWLNLASELEVARPFRHFSIFSSS
jgi:hypothetical protein